MPPPPLRWVLFACGLALAVCATGCGSPAARTYAVVLAEPRDIDCFPRIFVGNEESATLIQLANRMPKDWAETYDFGGFPRQGGELHTMIDDGRTLAWFAGFEGNPYYQWNAKVFEGAVYDDYIEIRASVLHVDPFNPGASVEECGQLYQTESELVATVDGPELSGRIRHNEYIYLSTGASPCEGHVVCGRSIAVTGAEQP